MASVYKETTKAGKIRLKFAYRDRNGTRRFIRIGRLNKKDAESFAWRVDQLASTAAGNSSPPADLIRWADGLPKNLRQKLIGARLVKLKSESTDGRWLCSAIRERMIEAELISGHGRCFPPR